MARLLHIITLASLCAACSVLPAALAQEEDPLTPIPSAAKTPPPPAAAPDALAHDEVELAGGERLQGDLVQVKGGKLKLKSVVLGEQAVALDKVVRLRTRGPHTVVFANGDRLTGSIALDGEELVVSPAGEPSVTRRRVDLSAVNPDPTKTELDYWSFRGTLGVSLTYGNTRNRTAAWLFGVVREDDWTKLALGYTGTYGVDPDGENAKNHRGDAQLDVKITDRFYATPFVGHMLYDKFQNIKLRYRAGAGAGYYVIKSDDMSWNVEAGGGYGETHLRDVALGVPDKKYETFARVASGFHWKINQAVAFDAFYEAYIGTKYARDTVHRATGNLAYKLTDGVALSLAAIYDRVESPSRTATGELPKRNDLKVILGLSVAIN